MNANLKRKVQVGLIFGFLLSFSNIGKCESDPFIFNGTYLNLRGPGISTASLDSSPNNIDAILNTSFKSITGDVPNLGTSNKSNFVRFRLTNNSDKSKIVIHQQLPYASHVSLFQLVGNKLQLINAYNISEKREGRAKDPFYFFTVNLPPHETGAFILMIKSGERLLVPLSVSTPGYFGSNLYKTRFILYGIFISVMLVMLLYNLFIYFSIK
ncbi:MAG: two-component system NtrC family sensor kinase, partial [Bacteroidia bacterium]